MERPVPLIDLDRCDGCGLCVRACPGQALAIDKGKAFVTRPAACDYTGLCAIVCPKGAVQLLFEIVPPDLSVDNGQVT